MSTLALSKTLEVSRALGTQTLARTKQAAVSTRDLYYREPVAVVNLLRFGLLCGMMFYLKLPTADIATRMGLFEAGLTIWQRREVSPVRFRRERRIPRVETSDAVN